MITKTKLKEQLKDLPEEFTLDELIDRLVLIEKVEKALKQSDKGLVISEDELDKEVQEWFK
jgi:predicted house-cleaning noncanonical NTP pyrophosphatase (MazG superfamily)